MKDLSPPKILILSNTRGYGGSETNLETILPYLLDQAQLHVVVENPLHHRNLSHLWSNFLHITKTPTGSSPVHLLIQFIIILWIYLQFQPDYVVANVHKAAFLLAALFKLPLRRPKTCAVIIQDFDYYYLPFILKNLSNVLFLAPTEAIFSDKRYRSWGLTRDKHQLIIFPCPTQMPEEGFTRSSAEAFIACAARIIPWKGIDYLIRAFAIVTQNEPAARLQIFGTPVDQEYYNQLLRLVTELGLENSVHFKSFTSNMRQVYTDAEFFVVPSLATNPGPESFCRIITEAWAFEKPSVAFAVGGPCYLIDHEVDGCLVEERNITALAEAIIRLWRNPQLRQEMGRRGHKKVRALYDPERSVTKLLSHLTGEFDHAGQPMLAKP